MREAGGRRLGGGQISNNLDHFFDFCFFDFLFGKMAFRNLNRDAGGGVGEGRGGNIEQLFFFITKIRFFFDSQ